ncbi:MAG: tetratricopeptide repeat protein, partial [Bacteroidales bacterium]|nr:tetratricopeptide repeat protein [Bacteroidales bacterium]
VLINYFYNKLKNTKLPFGDDIKNATKQSELLLESIEDESIALANLSIRVYLKHNLSKNYQTALKYNKKAIQILKSIDKLHPRLALCYRDSSFIYSKLGENQTALKYNKKDIHILEAYSGKYNYLLGDSYFAISRTYDELGDFSKAIEYGKKAIQIEKSYSKNKSKLKRLSALYNNLSHYYYMDNDIKNASIYINKAVNLIKKNKFDSNFDLKYILRNQKYFNSLYKLIVVFEKYKYFILGSALILTIALIYFIVSLFL